MKTIVITGATRGIGYGMADEFAKRGHQVIISGRTQAAVDKALKRLNKVDQAERVFGLPCDVRDLSQVDSLWKFAVGKTGKVDIWINNAGIGHAVMPTWMIPLERVHSVLDTNITGTYHGCRVAIKNMLEQGYGAVYNMEGYGSDGRSRMGLSIYGATKSAVRFLSDSIVGELKGSPVILGTLQPGMVATDLVEDQFLDKPEEWQRAKKIFNIFVETVGAVSKPIVEKILHNSKNGIQIRAFPKTRIFFRFLTAPFHKREVFK